MKHFIPFSPPDITEAEITEVAAALRSGWITTGPKPKNSSAGSPIFAVPAGRPA